MTTKSICRNYYYHYYRLNRLKAWKEDEKEVIFNRVADSWWMHRSEMNGVPVGGFKLREYLFGIK